MLVARPVVPALIIALCAFSLFVVGVVIHAWNDYQNSMLIEFRNATDERLCYVWGGDCTEIKANVSSYGDWGSCPARVTITTPDGRGVYSNVINCDDIDLGDLFILINKRDGEFVVLDNVASN